MRRLALSIAVVIAVSSVPAADPPTVVNYQGVLRDALDKPRTGTFDMVFRFFDAPTAGTEILVDSHTGGGGSAVTVSGGLFNVQLGGGTVADGSGAGAYTSLDQVFRDYGTAYLQVTVGAETLSPRIRIQSAAYALNASNLQGKPAAGFVDTSANGQTKAGHLVVSDGLEGNSSSAVGVQGIGVSSGGTFANNQITAIAHLGYNFNGNSEHYGVHGVGPSAGGWFHDSNSTAAAYLGKPGIGVFANGTTTGGYFYDNAGDNTYLASPGYGIFANGSTTGVYGFGTTNGGVFQNSLNSVTLASGSYGVNALGSSSGGFFNNNAGDGQAFVGDGSYGVYAYGSTAGGYFADTNSSGAAWIGFGDLGVDGRGAQAGGHFAKPSTTAEAYLAASNGFAENGVYGLSNAPGQSPGYFVDQYYGSYAYVGYQGYKIVGSGSVSFVQNDPSDASHVIVYTAPEGDETAVYTRGTARLTGGTARVALGETFARVANPDIGLTVQLTPHATAVPLAVDSVTTGELVVHGPAGAAQDVVFDYAVWGLRIGFENRPVVQPKHEEAFIPSTDVDDAMSAANPKLMASTARARFARMESAAELERAAARTDAASNALKAAIHVYDRDTDLPAQRAATPQDVGAIGVKNAREPRAAMAPTSRPAPVSSPPSPGEPVASPFPANTTTIRVAASVEAGDVVSNDPTHPGELRSASIASDPGVVGIVAGGPGIMWNGTAPLALAGSVVLCRVDASYGAIAPNDLLVASPTPGAAMRAGDDPRQGTVVGKALEPWDAGTGTVRVLVMSR
jgi:hypothetical protein